MLISGLGQGAERQLLDVLPGVFGDEVAVDLRGDLRVASIASGSKTLAQVQMNRSTH